MAQAEAGKGSKPRQQQDHDAYATGYDRIFGNRAKNNQPKEVIMSASEIVQQAYEAFRDDEDSGDDDIGFFVEEVLEHHPDLLPLQNPKSNAITVTAHGSKWFPRHKALYNGKYLCVVQGEGGGEGGGEDVSRIIGVFDVISHTYVEGSEEEFTVTVDYNSGKFCELNGYYYSYDGTTWDDVSDIADVKPKLVTVVRFS